MIPVFIPAVRFDARQNRGSGDFTVFLREGQHLVTAELYGSGFMGCDMTG